MCEHITTINIKNTAITPKSFLTPFCNPSLIPLLTPFLLPSNHCPFYQCILACNSYHIIINGVIQWAIFFVWFPSLIVIILRFIHDVTCTNNPFILLSGSIPLYRYMTICLFFYLLMEVMDIFFTFIVAMVSWVSEYSQTHLIIYIEYVQFFKMSIIGQ